VERGGERRADQAVVAGFQAVAQGGADGGGVDVSDQDALEFFAAEMADGVWVFGYVCRGDCHCAEETGHRGFRGTGRRADILASDDRGQA
jgi:hypothetical protein